VRPYEGEKEATMADKEINPKDPKATEVAAEDTRDEAERKSQAACARR